VAWLRHRVIVKATPNSTTRGSARKSVVMDSFAAAGQEGKYKRTQEIRKPFLALDRIPDFPCNDGRELRTANDE